MHFTARNEHKIILADCLSKDENCALGVWFNKDFMHLLKDEIELELRKSIEPFVREKPFVLLVLERIIKNISELLGDIGKELEKSLCICYIHKKRDEKEYYICGCRNLHKLGKKVLCIVLLFYSTITLSRMKFEPVTVFWEKLMNILVKRIREEITKVREEERKSIIRLNIALFLRYIGRELVLVFLRKLKRTLFEVSKSFSQFYLTTELTYGRSEHFEHEFRVLSLGLKLLKIFYQTQNIQEEFKRRIPEMLKKVFLTFSIHDIGYAYAYARDSVKYHPLYVIETLRDLIIGTIAFTIVKVLKNNVKIFKKYNKRNKYNRYNIRLYCEEYLDIIKQVFNLLQNKRKEIEHLIFECLGYEYSTYPIHWHHVSSVLELTRQYPWIVPTYIGVNRVPNFETALLIICDTLQYWCRLRRGDEEIPPGEQIHIRISEKKDLGIIEVRIELSKILFDLVSRDFEEFYKHLRLFKKINRGYLLEVEDYGKKLQFYIMSN